MNDIGHGIGEVIYVASEISSVASICVLMSHCDCMRSRHEPKLCIATNFNETFSYFV